MERKTHATQQDDGLSPPELSPEHDGGMGAIQSLAAIRRTPGYLIRRANQFATAAYVAELGHDEITGFQFIALIAIIEEPDLTGVAVADRIGYDKMTTSHVLRRLESKGLIERHKSKLDRREHLIRSTTEGIRLATHVSQRLPSVARHLFKPLDADEQQTLMFLLEKLERAARQNADTHPLPPARDD